MNINNIWKKLLRERCGDVVMRTQMMNDEL